MFNGDRKKIFFISSVAVFVVFSLSVMSFPNIVQGDEGIPHTWTIDSTRCPNDSEGQPTCNIPVQTPPNVGIPDLVEAVPQHIGLQNDHQRSWLRISTSIANIGNGQWQMRAHVPADQNTSQEAAQQLLYVDGGFFKEWIVSDFEYHPAHKHFHIADVSEYQLYKADTDDPDEQWDKDHETAGLGSEKVTFCLIDWIKIDDNSPNTERAYSACDAEFQGVSPGWMDQYHQDLEGQELEVTNLGTGNYFLVLTANPAHHFIESDFNNNSSWVLFNLDNDDKGNPKFEILSHSECELPGLCEYSANR